MRNCLDWSDDYENYNAAYDLNLAGKRAYTFMFYVYQGTSYQQERLGGYVCSPQLNKIGRKNAGYEMMRRITKGTLIMHNVNGKIVAMSVAECDCYEAKQPHKFNNGTIEGYKVDVDYYDFEVPISVKQHANCLKEHYVKDSAFTVEGRGKQLYMCKIANEHAKFFLELAINNQTDTNLIEHLTQAIIKLDVEELNS